MAVNHRVLYIGWSRHTAVEVVLWLGVCSGVPSGGGGFKPPSPEIPKVLQDRAKLNPIVKTVKIAEFRTPTPQDVCKKYVFYLVVKSQRA